MVLDGDQTEVSFRRSRFKKKKVEFTVFYLPFNDEPFCVLFYGVVQSLSSQYQFKMESWFMANCSFA
jgi:hypothetical protein